MSSILLAVIGSEVFVFNDVESLDQEPLRIIIWTCRVYQLACRNETSLSNTALT